MEHNKPHLHEIIRPVRELVLSAGEWIVGKVIPREVFDDFLQGGASGMIDNELRDVEPDQPPLL